jgi:copper chaperone CopZ
MKLFKSFVLVLFALTLSANFAFSQATTSTEQVADNLESVTIKVKGVGCSSDVKSIAGNIAKLDGVDSCTEGKMGKTTSFIIKYDPAVVTEKEIHAAIEGTAGCQNPDDRPYKVKTK